jgi:hypothetical protein
VLLVEVTLVIDDETVTSVVGVCDLSLPQETTNRVDAATTNRNSGGTRLAAFRANAWIDTTTTLPQPRNMEAHVLTLAVKISRVTQDSRIFGGSPRVHGGADVIGQLGDEIGAAEQIGTRQRSGPTSGSAECENAVFTDGFDATFTAV